MRIFEGTVVSNKMAKAVVIERVIMSAHPLYKKMIRKNRTVKAHTDVSLNVGDKVKYVSCRPMSKDVHFKVLEKVSV